MASADIINLLLFPHFTKDTINQEHLIEEFTKFSRNH